MPDQPAEQNPAKPSPTRGYLILDPEHFQQAIKGQVNATSADVAVRKLTEDLNLTGRFLVISESAVVPREVKVESKPVRNVSSFTL